MTARWVKYDGSDEQIAEIKSNTHGYIVRDDLGMLSNRVRVSFDLEGISILPFEYLICSPHPYADMICQWARTGQPVWVRVTGTMPAGVLKSGETVDVKVTIDPSNTSYTFSIAAPNWNIPGAEYSLTPFEEGV